MLPNKSAQQSRRQKHTVTLMCAAGGWLVLCLAGVLPAADSALANTSTVQDESQTADSADRDTEATTASDDSPEYRNEAIRGRVVWMAAALKSEFGISSVPEVAENSLALLTDDGQLLPIVENVRGRAFRKDERLRDQTVELLVRRHERHPLIQILRVYQLEGDQRYEVDYWCDVCAIIMFETGPCSCCQDDNRLRKRLVQEDKEGNDEDE